VFMLLRALALAGAGYMQDGSGCSCWWCLGGIWLKAQRLGYVVGAAPALLQGMLWTDESTRGLWATECTTLMACSLRGAAQPILPSMMGLC
jgi:hypothetical protein